MSHPTQGMYYSYPEDYRELTGSKCSVVFGSCSCGKNHYKGEENIVPFWRTGDKYGSFSNWSSHGFNFGGLRFMTLEHYIMYSKAIFFNDRMTASKILDSVSPSMAKKLGRQVSNYNDKSWSMVREGIVLNGLFAKAMKNDDFLDCLLSTGDSIIVESSPSDSIWGIGIDKNDENLRVPGKWGQNLLGKALMKCRKGFGCE